MKWLVFVRRLVQWALAILFLAAPALDLWRLDVINGRIYLFGRSLPWGQGYHFLLFVLAVAFGVLLMNLVVGRVFCSWACPQNSASELADWLVAGRYGLIGSLLLPIVSVILGLATLMYFVPPRLVISQFLGSQPPLPLVLFALVLSLLIYMNISRIRHLYCRWACPYGLLQTGLSVPGALRVLYPRDQADPAFCHECRACVEKCYMDINPMRLRHDACLNCGDCLSACEAARARAGQPRILAFSFGPRGNGSLLRALADPRALVALVIFAVAIWVPVQGVMAPQADFSVTRHPAHYLIDEDGRTVGNQFLVYLSLDRGSPRTFELTIDGLPASLEPDVITVVPGQNRTVPLRIRPTMKLPPGSYPFRIQAVSQVNPGEVHRAEAVYFVSN